MPKQTVSSIRRNKRRIKRLSSPIGIVLFLSTLFLIGALPCYCDIPATLHPMRWVLSFSDEFNSPTLDTSKWNTTYPYNRRTTPTNAEAEWYVDNAFSINNGILSITADKRSPSGTSVPLDYQYTSGMIASFDKFSQLYGYFEMRAKVPYGKGFWPAFWLLPYNYAWPPEIDVVELLGHQPHIAYFANHFKTPNGNSSVGGSYTGPDFTQNFHTFGVYWRPNLIVWYVDGIERFKTTSNVPQVPMYIIANLAVGGTWPGYPDATTVFPSTMQIDYIHAYQAR
jgi:beta-glucanase (GH16 family)